MNSTLIHCPFPTCILCVVAANFGKVCSDLQHIWNDYDMKDLLAPVSNSLPKV